MTSLYSCYKCNFVTRNKKDYNRHKLTSKHLDDKNDNPKNPKLSEVQIYECDNCQKQYTYQSGLCAHKKKCTPQPIASQLVIQKKEQPVVDLSLVFEFMKQTQEFKNLIIEQQQESFKLYQDTIKKQEETQKHHEESQKQMFEMMKDTIGTHNTMINSHNTTNNKFNLNVFLNETCKDAMNITEFIDSISVNFEDVEYSGKYGFTEGVSRIFLRELNKLDVCKRPIHCSDLKREIFHIKTKDSCWENERSLIFKIINLITRKNMFILKDWSEANPLCMNTQTAIHDRFVKLKIACFGPYDDKVEQKEYNKIIAKIAKATTIDKKAH